MNVVTKDASITPVANPDDPAGEFEVILSTPDKDRDGDVLLPAEWKTPLPGRITFDLDHGMSVGTTIGSGVPHLDEQTGNLIVRGRFSTIPRAQEVRTLVREGHITTTSVAFLNEVSDAKDVAGKQIIRRELLNGAFVSIPSNRQAVVLSIKSGARNSAADQGKLQAIHDHAVAMGASCPEDPAAPAPKSFQPDPTAQHDPSTRTVEHAPTAKALGASDTATPDEDDQMRLRARRLAFLPALTLNPSEG